ncbi:MAG TPA: GNAT family N-acetyltransferase [Mycobacteriales bacterium]|jgi:GNAT superfamily N-acetyltransferase|nr:GNAT family N-acetyltransferase [Mycobacteriales bacterium]
MPRIEVLDARDFELYVRTAAHIYGAAMQRGPEMVVQRCEIMHTHLDRRGYLAVVALDDDDALVGFGYGYLGRRGEWWHDIVTNALGRELGNRWMSDAFELAELHVLPAHQGHGIGTLLLDEIVTRAGGSTMVLSTHDRESPARRLYRATGFVDLYGGVVFPGTTEVYAIMGKDL